MIANGRSAVWLIVVMILVAASVADNGWGDEPARLQQIRRQLSKERVPHRRMQKMLDAAVDVSIPPEVRIPLCDDLLAESATDRLRARAWLAKCDGLMQLGKSDASLEAAAEAMKFASLADDAAARFYAQYRIGRARAELGQYGAAEETLLDSISLGRALPTQTTELAACYLTLATTAYQTDKHLAAIEYSREAYDLGQKLKAADICLATSVNLCGMHADRGDLEQATAWLRKAKEAASASSDPRIAFALRFCDWNLQIKQGARLDLAAIRKALEEADQTIDHELRATARGVIADAERRQGAWSDSIASFRQAIGELADFPRPQTEARLGLARVLLEKGDLAAAEKSLAEINPRGITTERQIEYWELHTRLSIQQGNEQRAEASLERLLEGHRAKYAHDASEHIAIQEARMGMAEKDRELTALRHAQAAAKANAAEAKARAVQSRTLSNMMAMAILAILACLCIFIRGRSTRRLAQRLQDQQQLLNAELQQVVETQTASLRREMESRRQLQNALHHKQRHEAIGKLTGGVAHDFNNLLTAIINSNNTLRNCLPPRMDQHARDLLDASDEAAKSGAEIVQALLAYARQQSLQPTPVDLHAYFNSTRSLFRSILGDGMHLVEVNELDPGTTILVDRGQFTTSIINLLTNARDASQGHGPVTMSLRHVTLRQQPRQTWTELPAGPYVSVTVQDYGCGMSAAALSRAFEPFFTSKAQESGSGLGLSVVYGFVKQSRGDVHLDSSEAGTVVALLFPQADRVADATEPAAAAIAGKGELVLVVDDNDLVRRATAKLLAASGFEVREARHAAEAVRLIESGAIPDIVLTDVVMPGEHDGIGLANWLQQHHPEVRVVLCSGYALNDSIADLDVVCKPYTSRELISALLTSPAEKKAVGG